MMLYPLFGPGAHRRRLAVAFAWLAAVIAVVAAGYLILEFSPLSAFPSGLRSHLYLAGLWLQPRIAVGALVVAGVAFLFLWVHLWAAMQEEIWDAGRAEADASVEQAFDALGDQTDLAGLLRLVRAEVSKYNVETRQQAHQSFFASQVAIAVGFLWLLGWGAVAVFWKSDAARLAAGGLAAAGGAISAFINHTYMSLHKTSLQQQSYYYGQPVMTYLLLQAERLANVTPSTKEQLYGEIVRMLIRSAERMVPGGGSAGPQAGDEETPTTS